MIEFSGFLKDLSFSGKFLMDSRVFNGTVGDNYKKTLHNPKDFL